MTKFKAMKFQVESKEHSKTIQKVLFELGYTWNNRVDCLQHLGSAFLFTNMGGFISQCPNNRMLNFYLEKPNQETTLEELYDMLQTKQKLEETPTKRHPHADLIIAWANGVEIECYNKGKQSWWTITTPSWDTDSQYRIKPMQTDIERYGIEVGDIWKVVDGQGADVFIVSDPNKYSGYGINQQMEHYHSKEYLIKTQAVLLFRKGAVDKWSDN